MQIFLVMSATTLTVQILLLFLRCRVQFRTNLLSRAVGIAVLCQELLLSDQVSVY